jgi:phage-related protein
MQDRPKIAKGQLLFGDMWFIKKRSELRSLNAEKKRKAILLLLQFGHLDLAESLTEEFKDELPELDSNIEAILGKRRTVFAVFLAKSHMVTYRPLITSHL